MGSMKAIFWAVMLIIVLTFMLGLFILEGSTDYFESESVVDESEADKLRNHFGSVGKCMLSLYKATTNGEDWANFSDVLELLGTSYHAIFLMHIAFYTCVVSNAITSLFL